MTKMTKKFRTSLLASVACLGVWAAPLLAGAPDPAMNLLACLNGRHECDRSRLTLSELGDVARVDHARNVTECRNGLESCDRSRLTPPEAIQLAVAQHDRNVSNCTDGFGACDPSRLTTAEARDAKVVLRSA